MDSYFVRASAQDMEGFSLSTHPTYFFMGIV